MVGQQDRRALRGAWDLGHWDSRQGPRSWRWHRTLTGRSSAVRGGVVTMASADHVTGCKVSGNTVCGAIPLTKHGTNVTSVSPPFPTMLAVRGGASGVEQQTPPGALRDPSGAGACRAGRGSGHRPGATCSATQ